MKHIRISPWLIVILAAVMILAAGCNRPDPQVAIDTPQSPNVPAEPLTGGTPAPGAATLAPGEATLAPGAATPTLPPPWCRQRKTRLFKKLRSRAHGAAAATHSAAGAAHAAGSAHSSSKCAGQRRSHRQAR